MDPVLIISLIAAVVTIAGAATAWRKGFVAAVRRAWTGYIDLVGRANSAEAHIKRLESQVDSLKREVNRLKVQEAQLREERAECRERLAALEARLENTGGTP